MKAVPGAVRQPGHAAVAMGPAAPGEVLVLKTSVGSYRQVEALRPLLDRITAGTGDWNFDLEDRDRILRVEAGAAVRERVVALLEGHGFTCGELE